MLQLPGHSSETPSTSPGASRRPFPYGDADGGVSPTLAFDSNPSAFDDVDADPASNHNSTVNNRHRGFGYVPPTQSGSVGALGDSNAYGYPGLNLSNFPGPYHPGLLSQLYSADSTRQTCLRARTLPKCMWRRAGGRVTIL
jgi:hypothetical protein